MSKYVCQDCGRIFTPDSADFETEYNYAPYGEGYATEELTYMYCPDCGGESYKRYYGDLDDGDNIEYENEEEYDDDDDEIDDGGDD